MEFVNYSTSNPPFAIVLENTKVTKHDRLIAKRLFYRPKLMHYRYISRRFVNQGRTNRGNFIREELKIFFFSKVERKIVTYSWIEMKSLYQEYLNPRPNDRNFDIVSILKRIVRISKARITNLKRYLIINVNLNFPQTINITIDSKLIQFVNMNKLTYKIIQLCFPITDPLYQNIAIVQVKRVNGI